MMRLSERLRQYFSITAANGLGCREQTRQYNLSRFGLFIAVTLSLIAFSATGRADHLPENLQARGKPETKLAGVRLSEHTRLADFIKLYGRPTKMKAWESDRPNFASSYDYYWVRPGLKLHVLVQRLPIRMPGWEYVSLVEVDYGTSRRFARTGKGLKIGDSLKDFKSVYGLRVKVRDFPEMKIHDVIVQWHGEEYSLVAALDKRDRITALSLFAPE